MLFPFRHNNAPCAGVRLRFTQLGWHRPRCGVAWLPLKGPATSSILSARAARSPRVLLRRSTSPRSPSVGTWSLLSEQVAEVIYQRRGIRPPPVPAAVDEPSPCDDRLAALGDAPDAVVAEAEARPGHGVRSSCFPHMAPCRGAPTFVRRRGITVWSVRITRHRRQKGAGQRGKMR